MSNPPWCGQLKDETYHGMLDHISSSMLKTLAHSPAHLRHMLDNPAKETDAMRLGRAVHCLILDGQDAFDGFYRVKLHDGRTSVGKEEAKEFERLGLTAISQKEVDAIKGMAKAFKDHSVIMEILKTGEHLKEKAILWQDNATQLLCRAKPDIFGVNFMIDFKSTVDARPHRFNRQFFDLGYHIQAAHYAAGFEALTCTKLKDFYFFAAEKEPPFANMLYVVSNDGMAYGQRERARLMRLYAECEEDLSWPGYGDRIEQIKMPFGKGIYNNDYCTQD